ncbi:tetratricopeptide repeat-containing protein [Rhodococcus sp. JS3073]|uniref:tetratricopeptide repeat-containing protein n=1 Tax=Rhodococcus sp. JS3073 TaxID=3002901 RepID=UPI002285434D|nr:tetratricopeptide repeat-containing protein [Rhodococcus sp. JS3073]WAM19968.1 hypothetical protein OYT95_40760 [Rhodococcus sp. JS3073]
MPKPIAFMVMPFGVKSVDRAELHVPGSVDFDALWERVYLPVLGEIGYEAVRADRDLGALIITEMIQRLTIADLVVADLTLPNANVYYEVGVRHAAQQRGCVLLAADWARPMFDLAQMTQLRFPLTDGSIPEHVAKEARTKLIKELKRFVDSTSPVFDAVTGYPDHINLSQMSAFRATVDQLFAFDADVREVRSLPAPDRATAARAVAERYGYEPAVRDAVALQLLRLLCETAQERKDWAFELNYIRNLPARLVHHPIVAEQRALALAKKGDVSAAAAAIEQFISTHGATSERYGLLGGRYKQLLRAAVTPKHRRHYLAKAIDSYENGMLLDLNNYYPASNLPRLYRERGMQGDLKRAEEAAIITTEACRRADKLGAEDEWTKSAMLGIAFFNGDLIGARKLTSQFEADGPGAWQLEATIGDLQIDTAQQVDPEIRAELNSVLDRLVELISPPTPMDRPPSVAKHAADPGASTSTDRDA